MTAPINNPMIPAISPITPTHVSTTNTTPTVVSFSLNELSPTNARIPNVNPHTVDPTMNKYMNV